MTITEFRAWLDGFGAAMSGAPTEEQWATIKAKIATMRDAGSYLPNYRLPARGWLENEQHIQPLRAH